MLVLGYIRVSSIEQEQGFGPQVQRSAIQGYCASNELSPPEIVEESESAESIAKRVVFQQVLARAKASQASGQITHVVVFKLDRLARDLLDQESVVAFALRYGFRLHSTASAENDSLNPAYAGDPMRVAIRQFFGMFAQLERATIQGRLDLGLAAKAKDGGSTGGRMAFGYRPLNDDIAIDPEAVPIVRRLFELHDRGLDQSSVAALLAREFPQRCGHWGKSQVCRALKRRDLYARGLYQSRLGVRAVERPELRILDPTAESRAPLPAPTGAIEWERFTDPLSAITLGLLVDRPQEWIKRKVTDLRLAATWWKGRMLLPRSECVRLHQISIAERTAASAVSSGVDSST